MKHSFIGQVSVLGVFVASFAAETTSPLALSGGFFGR
jgi:hypothetical protein